MTSSSRAASPDDRAPTHLHVPRHRTSAGEDVQIFAGQCGLVLDPWQAKVVDLALGENGDRWAAFEVGICCPRQNGKSAILEAVMLTALFLDGGETIYSAHEFKTAQKIWRRFDTLVRNIPSLESHVIRRNNSTNEMGLELDDGSRLQFLARAGTQGRGFTADRMIFDEAMILSAESMGAMIPTLSARRNTQVWYAGSAGFAGEESDHWRSIRDRGRSGSSPRLAWFEWALEEVPDDLRDYEARATTNPSFPHRLTEESLDDELSTLESREETIAQLVRERFGVWDEPASKVLPRIPHELWKACEDGRSTIVGPPVFGLHVTPDRVQSTIGVAGRTAQGRLHLEVAREQRGTSWVVGALAEMMKRNNPRGVVVEPNSAAGALIADLEAAGVPVTLVNGPEMQQASGAVFDAVIAGDVRHIGQKPLDDAVFGAVLKPTIRGGSRWYQTGTGYIAALEAVTVAAQSVLEQPAYDVMESVW